MLAEIIIIGDEILIGQVADTNSAWLAARLNDSGLQVNRITAVADRPSDISAELGKALERVDIVLTTGGLGPTKDDLTKKVLADFFGMELALHQPTLDFIGEMLARRGVAFNTLNRSQALLPEGCIVLPNRNGTAPGMWFERNGKVVVSMPGVPFEMKALIDEEILPRLKKHFRLNAIVHKTAVTHGLAESLLAETIAAWEEALPAELRLAYLPSPLGVRLRLSAYEVDRTLARQEIARQFELLEQIIPQYIVGYDDASIESVVGELLLRHGETVAVAESCTGGTLASRITLRPGASEYFRGGVVAYANEVKINLLGVKKQTLEQHGAVSRETAVEMAEGIRRVTGATYGIATTGVAGPSGGSPEKPVGTVWMAVATPAGVIARKHNFGALREPTIQRASAAALNLLRLYLKGFETAELSEGLL